MWTDGFASYFTLGSHFSGWDYVNHKHGFIDKSSGVHTNDCEGAWKWLKDTIPGGSPRNKVEEYVQLYCFKQWLKTHPQWKILGLFGGLGRASAAGVLPDKGGKGDDIPNMVTAEGIVARNPLPEPPQPPPSEPKPRGRPAKRRRRRQQVQEI